MDAHCRPEPKAVESEAGKGSETWASDAGILTRPKANVTHLNALNGPYSLASPGGCYSTSAAWRNLLGPFRLRMKNMFSWPSTDGSSRNRTGGFRRDRNFHWYADNKEEEGHQERTRVQAVALGGPPLQDQESALRRARQARPNGAPVALPGPIHRRRICARNG